MCEKCGSDDQDDVLLVCDDCERMYHTFCLDPRLDKVPEGGWKCNDCVVCFECGARPPANAKKKYAGLFA